MCIIGMGVATRRSNAWDSWERPTLFPGLRLRGMAKYFVVCVWMWTACAGKVHHNLPQPDVWDRKPAPRQWPLLLRLANPAFSCSVVYHKLLPPCSALSNKHDELLGHRDQTTWPQLFCTCVWVSFLLSLSCCPYSGSPDPHCVRTWQFKML